MQVMQWEDRVEAIDAILATFVDEAIRKPILITAARWIPKPWLARLVIGTRSGGDALALSVRPLRVLPVRRGAACTPGKAALKPRQRPPRDARRLARRIAAGATSGLRISVVGKEAVVNKVSHRGLFRAQAGRSRPP